LIKKILITTITIIIILLTGFFIFNYFQNKKLVEINKQLEIRDERLKELEKKKKASEEENKLKDIEIEKLKKQKVITKTEYVYLTGPEKEKAYNNLYDNYQIALKIIDDSTKIIETKDKIIEKQGQIIQTDEQIIKDLKGMVKIDKNVGINILALGGFEYRNTGEFKPEIMICATVEKCFDIKLIKVGFEGGLYVKPLTDIGGGLVLGLKVRW
jgi:hypothetical protein